MSKTFIAKNGASNFYMINSGMGGFLNPPKHAEHAEHTWSIAEYRGGHLCGSFSLLSVQNESWMPDAVKDAARRKIEVCGFEITEEWIQEVYKYFAHSYSPDGIDRNVSHAICYGKFWKRDERHAFPEHHLGYLFVKEFDANHVLRSDLIQLATLSETEIQED